ncbi:MAG: 4-hydroxy-tetrahydrodipicolinate synthase [Treponema sp.]|uniref:4-hydroxy-tetrahydrodipicolinate synthase n=1 Tax=Treponema sp. TaxID=166 RepID=UPI002580C55F|nr:4-hydroxy-tetrahydrodipicolinate synthase [Treponema sp.]MBQ5536645.1 4-hydroxy-tetrahydrodipicolinate synthase [Treponema sp.]
MIRLRGAITAMVTPMNSDGSVDYEGFRGNVIFQLESGIDVIAPLGTTGETPCLEEDEEDKLIRIAVEEARKYSEKSGRKVPVMIGTGSNNTKDAVRYTSRAKALGADVALVVTPYYNKPSDEGVFRHFEAVSKVGIPVLVYNIQGRTGKNIPTPLLKKIASLPNIIGVKEASGNIDQMMHVIKEIKLEKPDFAVLSGDDSLTLPLIALGGDGVVSVVSNIAPSLIVDMVHSALDGNLAEARRIHYRLMPFFRAAFIDGNPTSIKYAMNFKGGAGLAAGAVRLPLVEVHDEAKKIIESALKECGI